MRAMVLPAVGQALQFTDLPMPIPSASQTLLKVLTCGICRTDLHIMDGELAAPKLPLVLGHQIVAKVVDTGALVGVPWLGYSCGKCEYCARGDENLCDNAKFTGFDINGGLAEYCVANLDYCIPIPERYSPVEAAPLLCAGLIGYRSYRKLRAGKNIGLYGFGSAAHILIQIAKFQGKQVYVFTKEGDTAAQDFALQLGATWAGSSEQVPPVALDAAIIFAPVGALVPAALAATKKGGIVVCAGIHMSAIPSFAYDLLWDERVICSVANSTRQDGVELLEILSECPVVTEVNTYRLQDANVALADLRAGNFNGSGVVVIDEHI